MHWDFYWPEMENDVYATIRDYQSCAWNSRMSNRHRQLRLLPPISHLEFVEIDMLGPFLKNISSNPYVMFMTDRYSKLTKATLFAKTTETTVTNFLLNDWISSREVPAKVLTYNGPHFRSKFIKTVCVKLRATPITTTEYQPQSSRQLERFNASIVSRLHDYVSEHQHYWNRLVTPLTYAYNKKVRRATKLSASA